MIEPREVPYSGAVPSPSHQPNYCWGTAGTYTPHTDCKVGSDHYAHPVGEPAALFFIQQWCYGVPQRDPRGGKHADCPETRDHFAHKVGATIPLRPSVDAQEMLRIAGVDDRKRCVECKQLDPHHKLSCSMRAASGNVSRHVETIDFGELL